MMALRAVSILLLGLLSPAAAAGRQPATAAGAVGAREKLAPKATPMSKVIELLKGLTVKVEAQGKEEAAQYDKYACFCKEQADGKLYAMDMSDKKLGELKAETEALTSELAELADDISTLGKDIETLEKEISDLDENRTSQYEKYENHSAELVSAIDACERAIDTMKESKVAMEGKAETEALLQQVNAAASSRRGLLVLTAAQESVLKRLARGARGPTDGEAYESEYHSNEVIETLEDIKDQFIKSKNDLDTEEFESKKWYDNQRLERENQKKFSGLDKEEKERVSAEKEAKKEAAEQDSFAETKDKKADDEFLEVLKAQCQEKAELWDQRSKTNAEELQALALATEALESGAAPNWKANKKLNDFLQTHHKARKAKAPSFLQLRRGRGKQQDLREKATALLGSASERLSSSVLAMVNLRVQVSDDHFVKVRGMIKDLILRLEEDAAAEQTKKGWCDERMKKFVSERDDQYAMVEKHFKDKTENEAHVAGSTRRVVQKDAEIAESKKGLMEKTQLRGEAAASNAKTVGEAKAGLEAVKQAITILEEFYNNAAFLQSGNSSYTPFKSADSDRTGKTVGDYAPEVFDDEYKGQQEASKGIIGTLQVIQADFENTIAATYDADELDEAEYQKFKEASDKFVKEKVDEKEELIDGNWGITWLKSELVEITGDLSDSTEAHELAVKELESLRASCVEKEETYEERVGKRKQEIEALKEAHDILEDWEIQ